MGYFSYLQSPLPSSVHHQVCFYHKDILFIPFIFRLFHYWQLVCCLNSLYSSHTASFHQTLLISDRSNQLFQQLTLMGLTAVKPIWVLLTLTVVINNFVFINQLCFFFLFTFPAYFLVKASVLLLANLNFRIIVFLSFIRQF